MLIHTNGVRINMVVAFSQLLNNINFLHWGIIMQNILSRKIYTYVCIMYIILCVFSPSCYLFPIRCSRKPVRYWNRDWPTKLQVLLHTFFSLLQSANDTKIQLQRERQHGENNIDFWMDNETRLLERSACVQTCIQTYSYIHTYVQGIVAMRASVFAGASYYVLRSAKTTTTTTPWASDMPALHCTKAVSTRGGTYATTGKCSRNCVSVCPLGVDKPCC